MRQKKVLQKSIKGNHEHISVELWLEDSTSAEPKSFGKKIEVDSWEYLLLKNVHWITRYSLIRGECLIWLAIVFEFS